MSTPSAIRTSPGTTRRPIPHPLSPRRLTTSRPALFHVGGERPYGRTGGSVRGLSGSARLPGEDRQDAEVARDRGQAPLVSAVWIHNPEGQVACPAGDEGEAGAVRRPGRKGRV